MDYRDLFKKVENAVAVYTSELDHSTGAVSNQRYWFRTASKKMNDSIMRSKSSLPYSASRSGRRRASWNTFTLLRQYEVPSDCRNESWHAALQGNREPRACIRQPCR